MVLFYLQQDVLICRVTSAQRGGGPLDVALVDWQSAGLLRPSVAAHAGRGARHGV